MWKSGHRMPSLLKRAILCAIIAAPLPASVLLTFQPSVAVATNGNPLSVDVVISGLGLPPEVGSFDVFVGFNRLLLNPLDITFGPLLGDPNLFDALTATDLAVGPGIVEAAEVSLLPTGILDSLQASSFTLFTVDFMGIGNGAVSFQYLGGPVDDGNGILIFGTKTIVPEASSSLLVGAAFGLLGLVRLVTGGSTRKHRLHVILGRLQRSLAAACLVLVCAASLQAQPRQRVCISVYRYGGAASGWVNAPNAGAFASGTLKSIPDHIRRANEVFQFNLDSPTPNVEWVWDGRIVEDLADLYGQKNGDIQWSNGAPDDSTDRPIKIQSGGGGGSVSPDIDLITKYIQDSECFPVVFVGSGLGAAGQTTVAVDPASMFQCSVNGVMQDCNLGQFTIIGSSAYPRTENPRTRQMESQISTLAHELGHATCLDPASNPQPPNAATPQWGDDSGHPPRNQGVTGAAPDTPEGFGFVVGPGFTDQNVSLRYDVMWFTGDPGIKGLKDPKFGDARFGTELFTSRQASLSNYCAGLLRGYDSPTFSVAPNGPSNLNERLLYYAPATPLNMPGTPPVTIEPADVDGISYGAFPPGRFAFKFTVDSLSLGLPNTGVNRFADRSSSEFAAPLAPGANTNIPILGTPHFGLMAGDQIDALEPFSPLSIDPNRIGIAGPSAKQRVISYFFTIAAGGGFDPSTIYYHTEKLNGQPPQPPPVVVTGVYATPQQLGLAAGDEIGSICVKENDFVFDATDLMYFTLKRNSPSVRVGTFSSADILRGTPNGSSVAYSAARLGLRATDEIRGLKCYASQAQKLWKACDVNQDGNVNTDDIQAIIDARNTQSFPGDLRDADGDGLITTNDARICTLQCDKPKCAK